MRYPIPQDTAGILRTRISQNRNWGLALDRFLAINDIVDDEGQPWENPADQWKLTDQTKHKENVPLSFGAPIPTLLKHVNARRVAMLETYKATGNTVLSLSAEPDYRLALGLGSEHVSETNLSLHRIYGFPIIPGSAVKGITRAWAYWEIVGDLGVPAIAVEEMAQRKAAKERTPLQLLDQLLMEGEEQKQKEILAKLRHDSLCISVAALKTLDLSN